jgi:Tol biopolymer transport system component
MHSVTTHAIYWEPAGHATSDNYKATINGYLSNVAGASGQMTNVYALDTQYCDTTGPISYSEKFGGPLTDTQPYPTGGCVAPEGKPCLKDAQVKNELRRLAKQQGSQTGFGDLYLVLLPSQVYSCQDIAVHECTFRDICAYHNWTGKEALTILYAVIPHAATVPGCDTSKRPNGGGPEGADPTLNLIDHEQNEAITDPTQRGWINRSKKEIGDICEWKFGPELFAGAGYNQDIGTGHYWIQQEWSNRSAECAGQPPRAVLQYAPTLPNAAEAAGFDASKSSGSVGLIVSYKWTFGDGEVASGEKVTHTYSSPGNYTVTLTVEDTSGLTDKVTNTISVASAIRGTVVFARSDTGERNLWSEKADGTASKQLTAGGSDFSPAMSADGSKVCYEHRTGGVGKLWVVNVDGSNPHEIPNSGPVYTPSWSRDGTKIAFAVPGGGAIDQVNADGTGLITLTHGASLSFPHYSPDGRTIYFSDYSNAFHLWRMNGDGTNVAQISSNETSAYDPVPSPDGTRLGYSGFSERTLEGGFTNEDVFISKSDGSSPVDITPGPRSQYDSDGSPAWAPDGGHIAFQSDREANTAFRVYIVRPDGAAVKPLTPLGWNAQQPSWGP